MRIARWAYALLMALVLLVPQVAHADSKPRIFCEKVEYTGPVLMVDGHVFVPAARFAEAMGWAAVRQDAAVCIAPTRDKCQLASGASGLFFADKAFTGQSQVQDGQLYVSLDDLTSFLGGTSKTLAEYNTIKLDVPGMPSQAAVANVPQPLAEQLGQSRYTLVEFYATW